MQIEYEATFTEIDKDEIRNKLESLGAVLEKEEFLQKRSVFHLPKGNHIEGGWMRVRDEGDKITMSIKVIDGEKIHNQKESCLTVDSYQEAELFLKTIGCKRKAYQENKRELWLLDEAEVTIDIWPFLEPFIEVEGSSEQNVRKAAEKLGFDWSTAKFCSVDTLYNEKYGVSEEVINNRTPEIVFDMVNPFLSK